MKISIIIPTHGRSDLVKRILNSAIDQTLTKNDWEVLVISNLEDKNLNQICLNSPLVNCYYHYVGSLGVNKARNLGIEHARGDILLFIDDDCLFPDDDFLTRVIKVHDEYSDTVGIGGRYLAPDGLSSIEYTYHLNTDIWLKNSLTSDNKTTNLVGGSASYKNSLFSSKMRFNEAIVFGGSETDFNARVIQNGGILRLCPEHDLIHSPNISFTALLKKAFLQGAGERRRNTDKIHSGQHFKPRNFDIGNSFKSIPKAYSKTLVRLLLYCFNFSFQVGYRWFHENKRTPWFAVTRSAIKELFYRIFGIFRRGIIAEIKYNFKYWFKS